MAIDPRGSDIKAFLAEDEGGPVVMLNLLRFGPDGEQKYQEYVRHFRATTADIGAEVLYVGRGSSVLVAEPGQSWDAVLLVRYPSRQAFSDMIRNPEYQAGTHLRTEALTEAVLQATIPWTIDES
jgi:uncharacterized protein (DUF1330 family)